MMPQPDALSLIPIPRKIERRAGEFALSPRTAIAHDAANAQNARCLRDLLAPPTGFDLPLMLNEPGVRDAIRLKRSGDLRAPGREGYALSITPEAVSIEAPETTGVFYGIQTLRQLLPAAIERREVVPNAAWRVPCLAIEDSARFAWRGYMLDESRHFHGLETVLRALDLMTLQKLNVLHWHLTDDQGWRLEIKGYPRLTGVGSIRKGTARGYLGGHDGIPHGGFYTQDEIRRVVEYAAERHITVVPEIEMPGHSLAALAAYPGLSCTGGPFEVATRFGPSWDVYCAGKEATFAFLQEVFDEVLDLFPSPYIHIGGDEAPKARWKKCPDCRARMQGEGLKDAHALQVYFTNRIAAALAARGRRAMGWTEILKQGLVESAVVQHWIGRRRPVVEAVRRGREVVMSSFWRTYLDHSYSFTSLSKAYAYEPAFPELGLEHERVLGLEAPLWTEMVPTRARLDYQTYPRLTAFAETGWSPRAKKDFQDFRQRLPAFLRRLDELGVGYAPEQHVEPPRLKQLLGAFTVAMRQTKTASA